MTSSRTAGRRSRCGDGSRGAEPNASRGVERLEVGMIEVSDLQRDRDHGTDEHLGAVHRAQRKPTSFVPPPGSVRCTTAKTPAPAASLKSPPRTGGSGRASGILVWDWMHATSLPKPAGQEPQTNCGTQSATHSLRFP